MTKEFFKKYIFSGTKQFAFNTTNSKFLDIHWTKL